jgi:hypothetical protein
MCPLISQVDWENERECFETFAAAIGDFYAMHPPCLPNPDREEGSEIYRVGKSKKDLNTGMPDSFSHNFSHSKYRVSEESIALGTGIAN